MQTPKYSIGKEILIYEKGRLVLKTITKIRILITEREFRVSYQFDDENIFKNFYNDIYKEESEVFESLEHFIELNNAK